ncbi:MAG: FtsX-like permease family protein [Treponema sp.]|jgi:ABC-type lipoprotein release transport system permease subunit|nr:FtsX-like permease family protein [Treponema sp.]
MERFFAIIRLGTKYLYRYKRRYGFLIAALVFGFAIVTFFTSIKDGMYDNMYYSAQSHYAGDIVALFGDSSYLEPMSQNEISAVLNAALVAEIKPKHTVQRTILFKGGTVFYNGNAVDLRHVIGCDWENEAFLFSRMDIEDPAYVEYPSDAKDAVEMFTGDDSIVLSSSTALLLGARLGDRVTLMADTSDGQRNTAFFIVRRIAHDDSFFSSFKAYISRLSLNRLMLYGDEDCSTIGFFLDNPNEAEKKRIALQNVLQEKIHTGPLIHHRDEFNIVKKQIDENAIFLYTLPVYLSEVSNLLETMNIITYFIYGAILLIILVSASVTYRLILHERAREMGIMRVIGFYGKDLRLVLWTEIIVLGIISMIAGFFLANFLSLAISQFSFSWFPSSEIFMKDGYLKHLYIPATLLNNIVLIFIVLFVLALFPSFRVARKNIPQLLSGESL